MSLRLRVLLIGTGHTGPSLSATLFVDLSRLTVLMSRDHVFLPYDWAELGWAELGRAKQSGFGHSMAVRQRKGRMPALHKHQHLTPLTVRKDL